MKYLVCSLALLCCVLKVFSQNNTSLHEIEAFGTNPGNLKCYLHSLDTATIKEPLVVVLHGCGQDAQAVANLTGWNKLADFQHFRVLYPQQRVVNNPNNCFNWFELNDITKGKGECESIYQMIQYLKAHYAIDTNRIYIAGLSAGAAMSMAVVATHPALFKGVAIFEGGAYKIATNALEASGALLGIRSPLSSELVQNFINADTSYHGPYPTLLAFQGMNDLVVNPKNLKWLTQQWCGIHHVDTIPDFILKSYKQTPDLTRTVYTNDKRQRVLITYQVKNMGHQVLIKPGLSPKEGGQLGLFGCNKGFHSTYEVAWEFGLILPPKPTFDKAPSAPK